MQQFAFFLAVGCQSLQFFLPQTSLPLHCLSFLQWPVPSEQGFFMLQAFFGAGSTTQQSALGCAVGCHSWQFLLPHSSPALQCELASQSPWPSEHRFFCGFVLQHP